MKYDSISYPGLRVGDRFLPFGSSVEIVYHDSICTNIEGVVNCGHVLLLLGNSTRGDGYTSMECGVGCIKGSCPQDAHTISSTYSPVCMMGGHYEACVIRPRG